MLRLKWRGWAAASSLSFILRDKLDLASHLTVGIGFVTTCFIGLVYLTLVEGVLASEDHSARDLPTQDSQCEELRTTASALQRERASINDTEDILALAVGMETLDSALNDAARDYARLNCGR